jgi:hypothetical protein
MTGAARAAAGLAAVLAAAAGCTFERGDWFATLRPMVSAVWSEQADRSVEPGWQKLASEYQLRIDSGELRIAAVELLASAGGANSRFDPAHPPPGYTLCHNGHCHTTDGRLVPYADIEAELAGGGATSPVTVTLASGSHNLLAPDAQSPACQPSCQLGLTQLTRLRVLLAGLRLAGEVRDGPGVRQSIGQHSFSIDLAPAAMAPLPPIVTSMDLPADNRHPPLVTLELAVQPSAGLFDGVDWAADPSASTEATLAALREKLSEIPLVVHIARSKP